MERLFRIDFYPQDWLVKTQGLTPEQCGFYIQIVALIYASRGPVPNDPHRLSRLLKCSSRLTKSVVAQLVSVGKLEVRGEFITNSRAESELNMKRTLLESSAKGGRNKAENARKSNKNNKLKSSEGDFSLSSPSPTPSPTPTNNSNELFDTPLPPQAETKANGHAKRERTDKKLSGIPEDFGADFRALARATELNLDAEHEQQKFVDYWLANGKQKRDWQAAFRNWLANAAEYRARDEQRAVNQRSNVRDVTGAALRATNLRQKNI